ncbi:MAG: nitrogenase [Okeania sp. SIO2H7]|nr:nitrogenase [Okeania sp. SIO2H7]
MNIMFATIHHLAKVAEVWTPKEKTLFHVATTSDRLHSPPPSPFKPLIDPLRQWLDNIEVNNRTLARFLCKLIPTQCPFERDVRVFGRTLFHIPPMCKLNPLYDELIGLRFRALCYLADVCGEDVSQYC